MKKSKLFQLSLAGVAAFAISPVGGVAMAQKDHHDMRHRHRDTWACYEMKIENQNEASLHNTVIQNATSGSIVIDGTTTIEDVGSGASSNAQTTNISVEVDNSSSMENVPQPTVQNNNTNNNNHHHRHYQNRVASMEIEIENENEITVSNTILQTATSGNVVITDNTTVGDVTSGSAANTSTSTISISTK